MTHQIIQRLGQSKLLRGFSIYFGTSILNRALPFFLLPVLTRYLSPTEYGLLALYQAMIAFVVPFVGMLMQNNITRNFFRQSHEYLARLIFNLLLILLTTSTVFLLIVSTYILFGGELFSIPERWIYVLPLLAMMNTSNEFNLTIFRNQQRPFTFGIYEVSKTTLDLAVTLVLVVVYLQGWEGRASGILVASVALGLVGLIRLWKDNLLLFKVDTSQIREILSISLPLIPHAIGSAVITLSDRLFIERMVGTDAVGIYTIGYQFGMIMTLFVIAFNRSWSPWLYQQLANVTESKKSRIVKATYTYAALVLVLATGITFVSYLLVPLMTTKPFYGASSFVGWVAFGYAFHGMYTMVFPYLVHIGKTSFLGFITFFAAGINLAANYILIRLNGTVGAAQATLLSYVLMFICVWWYSHRIFPMPWFHWRLKAERGQS